MEDAEGFDSEPTSLRPATPSIITLPHELILQIITLLRIDSVLRLRATCRFFASFLRQPTHAEWLLIERDQWCAHHLTCGGCVRLRHDSNFSFQMRRAPPEVEWHTRFKSGDFSFTVEPAIPQYGLNPMGPGGKRAGMRFCNDCGVRDLPGEFRYSVGDVWDDEEVHWVRCRECKKVGRCPLRQDLDLCVECYHAMLEREGW